MAGIRRLRSESVGLMKDGRKYFVEVPASLVKKERWKEGEELDWLLSEGEIQLVRKEDYGRYADISELSDREIYLLYKSGRYRPRGLFSGFIMERIERHAEKVARKAIEKELGS